MSMHYGRAHHPKAPAGYVHDDMTDAEIKEREAALVPLTDSVRSLVMKHANAAELRAEAIREGMITMYEDGLRKALAGVTTFEEVLRATRES